MATENQPRSDEVEIRLTNSEALVLFEFATRFTKSEKVSLEDKAEACALWSLTAVLEKQLEEPFRPDYSVCLANARLEVRKFYGC